MFEELIITDDEIKKMSKELDSLLNMQQDITVDELDEMMKELKNLEKLYFITDEEMEKLSNELNSIQLDLEKSSFYVNSILFEYRI